MLVIVGLSKYGKTTIRVSVARPQPRSRITRNYATEREAAAVLRRIGVEMNAVEYYLSKLLPLLSRNEELSFPPMNIPQQELRLLGFGVAAIARTPSKRH